MKHLVLCVCCFTVSTFLWNSVWNSVTAEEKTAKPKRPFFTVCHDTHDAQKRSIEEQSQMLAELGFDGMMHLYLKNIPERFASAKKHGLKVTMVHTEIKISAAQPFDPLLGDALACLKGEGTMLDVTIYGGKPSDASQDDKVVGILQDMLKITEPLGIRIVLYPHRKAWNETVADCVRIAKRFSDKEIGVMFNLCHWAVVDKSENLEAVLHLAQPYLAAVTINGLDTPEEIQSGKGKWTYPLDTGSFDLTTLFKILDDIHYTGPVGLQCYGLPGDARLHLERSMKKWKTLCSE